MSDQNIFADDWRLTLRAHYIEVIRKQDTLTERTLENVMYEIGFTDADLQELRVYAKATVRAEDMGDDFTPDAELVSYIEGFNAPAAEPDIVEAPVDDELSIEEVEDLVEVVDETLIEDEALLDASEPEIEPEYLPEADEDDDAAKDDDSPAQLSLF
jgi:hypothetical protein